MLVVYAGGMIRYGHRRVLRDHNEGGAPVEPKVRPSESEEGPSERRMKDAREVATRDRVMERVAE